MASFDEARPGNSKAGDKKCAQCHTVEKGAGHKQGRQSGTTAGGYSYSAANKNKAVYDYLLNPKKKGMSHLPEDLVGDVLSRVPVASRSAVRCTCKSWNAISRNQIKPGRDYAPPASMLYLFCGSLLFYFLFFFFPMFFFYSLRYLL